MKPVKTWSSSHFYKLIAFPEFWGNQFEVYSISQGFLLKTYGLFSHWNKKFLLPARMECILVNLNPSRLTLLSVIKSKKQYVKIFVKRR